MPREKRPVVRPQTVSDAPRKRLAVMSAQPVPRPRPVELPSFDNGTSTSEALTWGNKLWEDIEPVFSRSKRAPLIVMAQPVKFWPDGEEPPFTGQKFSQRTFVTDGKSKPSKEITGKYPEIDRLKNAQRTKQIFHPRTGDIVLYHDYSDYEDSESDLENEHFQVMDDVHVNSGPATIPVCGSRTTPASDDDDEVEVYDGVVMTSVKPTSQCRPPEFILLDQSHSKNALAHRETAHQWINRGKKFPLTTLSTPCALQQLCAAVLTVPAKILALLIPPEDISVEDLINFSVPGISMWNYEGSITFQKGLPTSEVPPATELPPMMDVKVLRDKFGQALLDGKCSIFDPRFKDTLLPLWTIELWWQLHRVHASKRQWEGAHRWLRGLANTNLDADIFREAENQLCRFPANSYLRGPAAHSGRRTHSLMHLLSDSLWLSEPIIDVMVANLVARLDKDQCDFIIASTDFSDALLSAKSISYHEKPHSKLLEFEDTAKKYRYLCAPVHLCLASHFIAFEIDFHSRTFRYGDSLDQKHKISPKYIITRLQWWFEKRFNGKFTDLGPTLPHGQQKDCCSCGLFTINTIEHRIFGYPLGVPSPAFERVRWFALTAKDQILDLNGPGSPAVLPATGMDVLRSRKNDTKQEFETRRIKDMKASYLENEAKCRASRNDTSGTAEQERLKRKRDECGEAQRFEQGIVGRMGKERLEKEKLESENLERKNLEIEKEKLEKEKLEKERLERERLEKEKLEKEKLEKERLEREIFEKEKLDKEKLDKERLECEKAERDKEVHDVVMDDSDGMDIPPILQVSLSQSLDMEVEPGEILSHSEAPCLYNFKGKAVDHRDRSPDCTRVFYPRHRFSYYGDPDVHRPVSYRPLSDKDYPSSQWHRAISPPGGRSRSPVRSTYHNRSRSRSPIRAQAQIKYRRSTYNQSPIRQRSLGSPSLRHGPSSEYNPPTNRHPLISMTGHSMQVSSVVPSIHGSLPFTASVISAAAFDRTPPIPADTTTTRWIIGNTNCLKQFNLPNSLCASLTSPHLKNRIPHLICNPPYHLLSVISRGRLTISKRTELRLRLWRAQYPDVPLWFLAIHCLSRGLDWQVFVNPHLLVGPLYGVPAPRPAYLDVKHPLLNRMQSDVLNTYEDRVKSFLHLPFARRVLTKGGLLWRLAVHYGPDDLFLTALFGPSTDAFIHRNVDCNGTDIDDKITEDHINILIGLTSDNHSLWPPLKFFEIYQLWEGEWSPTWETWFMERIAAIHNRSKLAFIHRSQWSKKPRRHTAVAYEKESTAGTEAHARRLCEQIDQLHPFMGSFTTLG